MKLLLLATIEKVTFLKANQIKCTLFEEKNLFLWHVSGIKNKYYFFPSSGITSSHPMTLSTGQYTEHHLNSYIPSFQQHLNIMRSTYELLTSDFVEIEMAFRDCVQGIHQLPKDQYTVDCIIFRCCWTMVIELQFHKGILKFDNIYKITTKSGKILLCVSIHIIEILQIVTICATQSLSFIFVYSLKCFLRSQLNAICVFQIISHLISCRGVYSVHIYELCETYCDIDVNKTVTN